MINYRSGQSSGTSKKYARELSFYSALQSVEVEDGYGVAVYAYSVASAETADCFIGILLADGSYSNAESEMVFFSGKDTIELNPKYYYRFVLVNTDGSNFESYDISPLVAAKVEKTTVNAIGIGNSVLRIELPESFDTRAAVPIYKDGENYYTDFDITEHMLIDETKTTYYVSNRGSDSNSGLSIDSPLKNISTALNKEDCLTIVLADGTYDGCEWGGHNILGSGNTVIKKTGRVTEADCYIENLKFEGNTGSNMVALLADDNNVYINNCSFNSSNVYDACRFYGGNYYIADSICTNSYLDGFNYHKNSGVSIPHAVEINCKSYNTGAEEARETTSYGYTCNGSTIHDGGYIIRINGEYSVSNGGVLAEANAYSFNVGCSADTSTVDSDEYDANRANFWGNCSETWLLGCTSFGSKYDISSANGSFIHSDNMFSNNYCDSASAINTLEINIKECETHTPNATVTENETAATYENGGSYDSVIYCAVCGKELSRITNPTDKLIKNGWFKENENWYYYENDNAKTGWVKDGGKWYYLNSDGVMQTGWVKDGGSWYYLKSSGAMATGWLKDGGNWYYLKSSGAMATGWVKVSGKWYYMQSSGAMKTGWLKDGGKWYYLDSSGAMLANTSKKINGKTYKFNNSGVCLNP